MISENYFTDKSGIGVLSTANDKGEVDAAIYSKPHVLGHNQIAFIMRDRLTRQNLQSNPVAHYLFIEEGEKSKGIRLNLKMLHESQDEDRINALSRRKTPFKGNKGERFLVTFTVIKSLQLIGGDEKPF